MNYNSIKGFNLSQVNVSILSPLKASENFWFANVSIQDKRGKQGRRSRLKTGAAERSEEKQSHVVALYNPLGVWGAL